MDVFKYLNYREFLLDDIELQNGVRGYKTRLAQAAKCQKSYFSKVLTGEAELSHEQAVGLTDHWNLSANAADYFLDLITYARASNSRLKAQLSNRLHRQQRAQANLSERYQEPQIQPGEKENLYYSSWVYSAVHILTDVSDFQTAESLSHRLGLSVEAIAEVLEQLVKHGLVKRDGTKWKINTGNIHVPRKSPLSRTHHLNWRQRAFVDGYKEDDKSLHYTVIQSHSLSYFEDLKNRLLNEMDRVKKEVGASNPEEVTCLNIDFFRV